MGKLNAFIIQLQNQNAIFYAGQMVNGNVHVNLNADMKMREIRLKFRGTGNVYWTETRTETDSDNNSRTVTDTYSASEKYFDIIVTLYGTSLGHPDKLPAGVHNFPFSFTLPPNLPSSFEHQYGQVRYTLKATIDKPWKFDHTTKQPFTVVSMLDLNTLPEAQRPLQNQAAKTLCCLCCESGPITGVIRVDKSGFVPGEALYLQGEVQNLSNTDCSVEVKLNSTMLFHATSKTKTVSEEITKLILDRANPGDTQSLSGKRIVIPAIPPSYLAGCSIIDIRYYLEPCFKSRSRKIPALPPSYLAGCSIIDIRYYLELHINPSSMSTRLVVPVEVIIGSVPLRSAYSNFSQTQPAIRPNDISVNFVDGASNMPMPSAPEMPPPSYAECVFGKQDMHDEDDNEHTKGQMSYAPAYPFYNLS